MINNIYYYVINIFTMNIDTIKFSIISNLRTGNLVIDTLLQTVVIAIFGYLVTLLPNIMTYLKLLFNKLFENKNNKKFLSIYYDLFNKDSLEIENAMYSISFRAIINYLKNNSKYLTKDCITVSLNKRNVDDIYYVPCKTTLIYEDIYFTYDNNLYVRTVKQDGTPIIQINISNTFRLHTVNHDIEYIVGFITKIKNDILTRYYVSNNLHLFNGKFVENNTITTTSNTTNTSNTNTTTNTPNDKSFDDIKMKKLKKIKKDGKYLFDKFDCNSNKNFDNIFFESKNKLLKLIDTFLNNPESYKKIGSELHLSLLLSGSPGCGKTSFIKALMNYTQRHAININLKQIYSYDELIKCFSQYVDSVNGSLNIPINNRIYVFEDFEDTLPCIISRDIRIKNHSILLEQYEERKMNADVNHAFFDELPPVLFEDDDISLSEILNILDGIIPYPGRIIIFTTNHPEIIDPALMRPGRIDFKIDFKLASHKIIQEILNMCYDICVDLTTLIKIKEYVLSPAVIISICKQYDDIYECINMLVIESNK